MADASRSRLSATPRPSGGTGAGTATGNGTATGELTHRQILAVLTGLMLAMLLAALDQTIVSTALPTIVGDLGGLNHLSWVVTAYLLTSTATTPLYGRIGDLYGRKRVFQAAIVVFLAGSALCGAATSMTALIAFRAVQGLGSGGLMSLVFAIIAEVVPMRERGRYQGYFGAVFGLASVAGPLLGGFFTDHASWRWVFYVNLPVGGVALAVIAVVLQLPPISAERRAAARIDVVGALLLSAGVTALLLVTVWGGTSFPWASGQVIGTAAAGVLLLSCFVAWEGVARQPILPLRLFRDRVFGVCALLAVVSGVTLFGALVYLPEYQQVVKGESATTSGLMLLPLTVGVIIGSIGSGRIVSATGRYRAFPLLGSAVLAVGFWLLSGATVRTSQLSLSWWMLVVGLGIGLSLQVIVLAAQNAVPLADLGAATGAISFFRTLGGAFGTAAFGAVLTTQLDHQLPQLLPPGAPHLDAAALTGSPQVLNALPTATRNAVLTAFVHGFHTVYLVALPIALLGLLIGLLLPERPFRAATPEPASTETRAQARREELALVGVVLVALAEQVERDPAEFPLLACAVARLGPDGTTQHGDGTAWTGLARRAQRAAGTVLRPLALHLLVRAATLPGEELT
jgi:EmrB/QacA subfamily drug resistance transporter